MFFLFILFFLFFILYMFFFFFQAEDGIRDPLVTGVQTCALPICSPAYGKFKSYAYRFQAGEKSIVFTGDTGPSEAVTNLAKGADILISEALSQIGRASCRERV